MIFPGISAIRRTNDRHPDVGLTTAGFAALLLIIGLGSRQATGLVIGTPNVNHVGGRHGQLDKLGSLNEYEEGNTRRTVPEDGTFCYSKEPLSLEA